MFYLLSDMECKVFYAGGYLGTQEHISALIFSQYSVHCVSGRSPMLVFAEDKVMEGGRPGLSAQQLLMTCLFSRLNDFCSMAVKSPHNQNTNEKNIHTPYSGNRTSDLNHYR